LPTQILIIAWALCGLTRCSPLVSVRSSSGGWNETELPSKIATQHVSLSSLAIFPVPLCLSPSSRLSHANPPENLFLRQREDRREAAAAGRTICGRVLGASVDEVERIDSSSGLDVREGFARWRDRPIRRWGGDRRATVGEAPSAARPRESTHPRCG
jgi:hypothetical protein